MLGRRLELLDVEPEQLAKQSVADGVPAPLAYALQNLDELFRVGRAGVVTDDVENLTGVAPRTFRDW